MTHFTQYLKVSWTICCASLLLLVACDNDDEPKVSDEHEEELITTVTLNLSKEGSNETQSFNWKNTKGAGEPDAQSRDRITLDANASYTLSVQLFNESITPKEELTEEIKKENDEHLFVFLPSDGLNLSYTSSDKDSNDKPVGLSGNLATMSASSGNLRIVLRHEPTSKETPTDLSSVGGSTDVDISFEVSIGSSSDSGSSAMSSTYTITFESTWSARTHPTNFPSSSRPHYSPLIGAVHNNKFEMWAVGRTVGTDAAAGMEQMAETGGTPSLRRHVEAAISSGTAKSVIAGSGIGLSPGQTSVTVELTQAHPEVSLVSMIFPSPDWFIGVHNLSLFENGAWVSEKTIQLRLYDAGTDDGPSYSSANADSNPKEPISRLTSADVGFKNGEPHVGSFTFRREGGGSTPPPNPTITAINPTSGAVGTTVTITGTNFSATKANNTVTFLGGDGDTDDKVATVTEASPTQLTITVPPDAQTGNIEVSVTGASQAAESPSFTVTMPTMSASYTITFASTWSATTHPTNFPSSSSPHYSPLIGAVHNNQFEMWAVGRTVGTDAAAGMEQMAETGGTSSLRSYIQAAVSSGTAKSVIAGSGIGSSPGQTSVTVELTQTHPEVSLVSMIFPSPDWFIGVHNLSLFESGAWVSEKTIQLRLYDAGTDDGPSYSSTDANSSPKEPISRLTSSDTDFRNGEPHVGSFTFRRSM